MDNVASPPSKTSVYVKNSSCLFNQHSCKPWKLTGKTFFPQRMPIGNGPSFYAGMIYIHCEDFFSTTYIIEVSVLFLGVDYHCLNSNQSNPLSLILVSKKMMQNAKNIYPHNTPTTKEAYYYRIIFERFFSQNSARLTVPGFRRGQLPAATTGAALASVGKLVDFYLAEATLDSGVTIAAFEEIASSLPVHARAMDDGLYRAMDTYIKVKSIHPPI
ncbi:hypothetical protein ZIOFF_041473 [Zingiber officinale]|uniref:NPH3 domain-containing protein n=1 Tax=Zingiber officinale TaxID=94328 RepID=A0A8J5G550_ZINOF|nr:hypothetical protein ZIOFF_041473 [Zingiber officinale]